MILRVCLGSEYVCHLSGDVWSFLFQPGGSVLVQVSMFHEEMSL